MDKNRSQYSKAYGALANKDLLSFTGGSVGLSIDALYNAFSREGRNAKKLRRLPSAGLQLNNGTTYRFKTLNVKQNNFTFTTVALKGVSYSFSGKFLKGGVYSSGILDNETPVLEGTLTKFRNGQKLAEAKLKFVYFGGT